MKIIQFALRHRNILLLALALGLGGLAAFGARGYIADQLAIERDRLSPKQEMVQLVVAKKDLPRGAPVSADTMAVRELPRDYAPAGAVTPDRFDAIAGGLLGQPMRAGEPLMTAAVSTPDSAGFSTKVRSGIRALTIAVDEVNSLSGMLQPGDRIDLMLSVRLPAGSASPMPQEVTRALMQDIRILATGRQARPGNDDRQARSFNAITIEVTPEQAQKLVVAQRSGKLTALLRNPEDHSTTPPKPMDVYGLLDLRPGMPAVVPASPPTEVIVGGVGALRAGDHGSRTPAAGVASPFSAGVANAPVPSIANPSIPGPTASSAEASPPSRLNASGNRGQ